MPVLIPIRVFLGIPRGCLVNDQEAASYVLRVQTPAGIFYLQRPGGRVPCCWHPPLDIAFPTGVLPSDTLTVNCPDIAMLTKCIGLVLGPLGTGMTLLCLERHAFLWKQPRPSCWCPCLYQAKPSWRPHTQDPPYLLPARVSPRPEFQPSLLVDHFLPL